MSVIVWKEDPSRLQCYHCVTGDCTKQDEDLSDIGDVVLCPKGVTHCKISGNDVIDSHNNIQRSCFFVIPSKWMIDEVPSYPTTGSACDYASDTCYCGYDKCNTGFHGNNFILMKNILFKKAYILRCHLL